VFDYIPIVGCHESRIAYDKLKKLILGVETPLPLTSAGSLGVLKTPVTEYYIDPFEDSIGMMLDFFKNN